MAPRRGGSPLCVPMIASAALPLVRAAPRRSRRAVRARMSARARHQARAARRVRSALAAVRHRGRGADRVRRDGLHERRGRFAPAHRRGRARRSRRCSMRGATTSTSGTSCCAIRLPQIARDRRRRARCRRSTRPARRFAARATSPSIASSLSLSRPTTRRSTSAGRGRRSRSCASPARCSWTGFALDLRRAQGRDRTSGSTGGCMRLGGFVSLGPDDRHRRHARHERKHVQVARARTAVRTWPSSASRRAPIPREVQARASPSVTGDPVEVFTSATLAERETRVPHARRAARAPLRRGHGRGALRRPGHLLPGALRRGAPAAEAVRDAESDGFRQRLHPAHGAAAGVGARARAAMRSASRCAGSLTASLARAHRASHRARPRRAARRSRRPVSPRARWPARSPR